MKVHAQKPDFVFRRNGQFHLNRRGRQFSRLLAAKVWASAVVMLDTPCSEVVWRVLATQSIRQFPLHFPSRASPCAITFQLEYTKFKGPPAPRKRTQRTNLIPSVSFPPHSSPCPYPHYTCHSCTKHIQPCHNRSTYNLSEFWPQSSIAAKFANLNG